MPRVRYDSGHQMKHYDASLAVMEAMTPHFGYAWSAREIAEVCGISRQMVHHILKRGVRKLQVRLRGTRDEQELRELLDGTMADREHGHEERVRRRWVA